MNDLKIISCPGTDFFTEKVMKNIHKKVCKEIGREVINYNSFAKDVKVDTTFTLFANGEVKCKINESIRGKDVYIFQDVANQQEISMNDNRNKVTLTINDHVMNLLVAIDTVRHASARRITLILPAYPYSRQHKKRDRENLSAALLSTIFERSGVSRIITLDIHSKEIENAFPVAVMENLYAGYQIIQKLIKIIDISEQNLVVVSPDTGAVERNRFYANELKKPLAMLYKERDYSKISQSATESNISSVKLLGDVKGKNCFIADDIIDTGGTIIKSCITLRKLEAEKIIIACSLPYFSGSAMTSFDEAYKDGVFYRIIGTNAVYHKELLKKEWYISTDISQVFGEVISRLNVEKSVSDIVEGRSGLPELLEGL